MSREDLLRLADQCQGNADLWLKVAANENPNFLTEDAIKALDTAVMWQCRGDLCRSHAAYSA